MTAALALSSYLDKKAKKRLAKAAGVSIFLDREASHSFLKVGSNQKLTKQLTDLEDYVGDLQYEFDFAHNVRYADRQESVALPMEQDSAIEDMMRQRNDLQDNCNCLEEAAEIANHEIKDLQAKVRKLEAVLKDKEEVRPSKKARRSTDPTPLP